MRVDNLDELLRNRKRRRRVATIKRILRPFVIFYLKASKLLRQNAVLSGAIAGFILIFVSAMIAGLVVKPKISGNITESANAAAVYKASSAGSSTTETLPSDRQNDANDTLGDREIPWYSMIDVDFEGLQEINTDIKGWIFFENENISYPLLYSGDNEKYLDRGYDGEALDRGSIFIDGRNTPDMEDIHTIIYGHNMKNGEMFGKLKQYERDEDYLPNHRYFQIIMPEKRYRYEIFGFEKVNESSDRYRVDFNNQSDVDAFMTQMASASAINPDITSILRGDKVISLSTCTSDDSKRLLVHAVRVDFSEE